MKLNKAVRARFQEYKENAMILYKDEIVKIIKAHADPIDMNKLVEQEIGRAANRLMAGSRDSNGTRNILATEESDGTFVSIENCPNLEMINSVALQLRKKLIGMRKVYRKVEHRQKVLNGQIQMSDILPASDEEN